MKTIFAATDYSEIGNNAVRYAMSFADAIDAQLTVFHTGPIPKFNPTISEAAYNQLEQENALKNTDQLNTLINQLYDRGDYSLERNQINAMAKASVIAADTILAEAQKQTADFIVIGTHGKSALQLFGTTSATVILQSKIPVIAIPPGYQYQKIETITYASDLRNLVNELKHIVTFAKGLDAQIEILHLDFGWDIHMPQSLLDGLENQVSYNKFNVIIQKEVKGLTILEQIESHIQSSSPDIIVMFPESRSYFDRLFGIGKTEELAYKTQLPLLTYRKEDIPSPA
ncbi:MAG: universal stress protein [Cyclobacteriaceae bacterium]